MIRLLHEPAPQLDSSDLRRKHRVFSLRVCPAFRSSLRYPAHSALVAELLIFDRGLMAEHAGSGAAAHEWEDPQEDVCGIRWCSSRNATGHTWISTISSGSARKTHGWKRKRLGAFHASTSNACSSSVHSAVPGHVTAAMGTGCLWALVVQRWTTLVVWPWRFTSLHCTTSWINSHGDIQHWGFLAVCQP